MSALWHFSFYCQAFLFFLVFLSSRILITSGRIIGLDLGNAYYKIATVSSRGTFEIIANAQSERKTPTAVCFADKTRSFGYQALQRGVKSPSETVSLLPSLIALNISDSNTVSPLSPYFPLNYTIDQRRGVPVFHFKTQNLTMGPEEILAHQLQHILQTVRRSVDSHKIDAVVTIPEDFRMRHRQAIAQAFAVAHINLVQFIQETPAAALYHAMSLQSGYRGRKLFINVGAWHTEACIVEYGAITEKLVKSGQIKKAYPDVSILWCESVPGVGGHAFDRLLADYLVKYAEDKFRFHGLANSSSILQRFLRQAERAKVILSTNKVADIYIENLQEGKSLRTRVTRETFEKIIDPIVTKIVQVVHHVFSQSNHTRENISSVEIIGGGWRVPMLQAKLAAVVHPHNLGQHLNAEESMAFGASLVAANITNAVRLRPIQFSYVTPLSYIVKGYVISHPKNVVQKILVPSLASTKTSTLVLTSCEDIRAELWEKDKNNVETLLESYLITGVAEKCQSSYKMFGKSKVTIYFKLHSVGWVSLERALAYWEEKYTEIVAVRTPRTNATLTGNETSVANVTDNQDSLNATQSSKSRSLQNTSNVPETTTVQRTKYHSFKCKINTTFQFPGPAAQPDIRNARLSLKELSRVDQLAAKFAQIQNTIESYAYKCRSTLNHESILDFINKKEQGNMLNELEQTIEWIYSSEAKQPTAMTSYEEKLTQLRDMMEPLFFRFSEREKREQVNTDIQNFGKAIQNILPSNETLDIPIVQTLLREWNTLNEWYNKNVEEQSKRSLRDLPFFNTSDVSQRLIQVKTLLEDVRKTLKTRTSQIAQTAKQIESNVFNSTKHFLDLNSTEILASLDLNQTWNERETTNSTYKQDNIFESTPPHDEL